MEEQLGVGFDGVRLHTDARADQLSRSLQALAFTAGSDIFFRRGGYAPGSPAGRHLLAHELAHVAQQRSGTGQPAVQRYIASVNHGLRDPKAQTDDYGTYRSLDVALKAGGGEVYKGPNTAEKGGRLDQLAGKSDGIQLGETEDLYLVGHGSKDLIGVMGAATVAKAVANITPGGWKGKIFSLNCWSAYQSGPKPSALEKLQQSLALGGRNTSASGPVGRSIRHLDWLGEENSPFGLRAVVAGLTDDEEKVYKEILEESRKKVGIPKDVELSYDDALRAEFKKEVETGQPIGVEKKAAFATEWGRAYQAKVVKRLKKDKRLEAAIAGRRLLFGGSGLAEFGGSRLEEKIAPLARKLDPGEQQVINVDRASERPLKTVRPPETLPPRDDAGQDRSWTWLEIAGVGLIGLIALGATIALIKRK